MILSILIRTIPKREKLVEKLQFMLWEQVYSIGQPIEILTEPGPGSPGAKCQSLLNRSIGEYVCFFDDDDIPSNDYVESIVNAISSRPDVVGFKGWITTNGSRRKEFIISKDCQYVETPARYERFNNHLCPVKRSIALEVGFNNLDYAEDYDYAVRLRGSGLIKTEVFIDKHLYHYVYVTKKSYR